MISNLWWRKQLKLHEANPTNTFGTESKSSLGMSICFIPSHIGVRQIEGSLPGVMTMPDPLPDWPRPHFRQSGERPFLFFVVCGQFEICRKCRRAAIAPQAFLLAWIDHCDLPGSENLYVMTAWNFLSTFSSCSGLTGFSKCTSMVASPESR